MLAAWEGAIALLGLVTDKSDHPTGLAVEAAPEADHLMLAGKGARRAQSRLDRLGAAAVKMKTFKPRRRRFGRSS